MEEKFLSVNISGFEAILPILNLPSGVKIAFFNLHGNQSLTEHCGKALSKYLDDIEIVITAESKGLQLAHVIARELKHDYYVVARKSKKLYMQDGLEVHIKSSITTGEIQKLYISQHDKDLLFGKRVAIVDDVVSTGNSLAGLEEIVKRAGGILTKKAFVLAEGDAMKREDIVFLASIPIM